MNDEIPYDVEEQKRALWKEFCKRYPLITSKNRLVRILTVLLMKETTDELSFSNGFYRGYMEGIKQRPVYVPPEPKSDQPESPGSHSSSHSQGGGSPDEDPSR